MVVRREITFELGSKRSSICCCMMSTMRWMRKKRDGVKAVGARNAAQLDNQFNRVIKVDIVLIQKKYFKQINTEHPSGIPWILQKALSCERYQHEILEGDLKLKMIFCSFLLHCSFF